MAEERSREEGNTLRHLDDLLLLVHHDLETGTPVLLQLGLLLEMVDIGDLSIMDFMV